MGSCRTPTEYVIADYPVRRCSPVRQGFGRCAFAAAKLGDKKILANKTFICARQGIDDRLEKD
jgi:hypothetical protein